MAAIERILSMMLNVAGDQNKSAKKTLRILDGAARGEQALAVETRTEAAA